ncbi:hypothetical protein CRYUN_Cryun37aG0032700 [Craigia yunnanensis]
MAIFPNLQTLFLNDNNLQVIRDGFFQFIPHLRVLNLSNNYGIKELPEGISELIALECLNLPGTGIIELPIKMKSLAKLKILELNSIHNFRRIPRHLISSFSKLQIFRMYEVRLTIRDYTEEDNVLNGGNESLIEELKSLQHLNMLIISVKDHCAKMEEILSEGKLGEVADVVGVPYPNPFPMLQTLLLQFLPELKSIYWDALPFPCLKRIVVMGNCSKLKKIPFNSDTAKGNQISIIGPRAWYEKVEWEDDATRDVFLPSFEPSSKPLLYYLLDPMD